MNKKETLELLGKLIKETEEMSQEEFNSICTKKDLDVQPMSKPDYSYLTDVPEPVWKHYPDFILDTIKNPFGDKHDSEYQRMLLSNPEEFSRFYLGEWTPAGNSILSDLKNKFEEGNN